MKRRSAGGADWAHNVRDGEPTMVRTFLPKLLALSLLGSVVALGAGCAPEGGDDSQAADSDLSAKGKIQLLVTVDWEGRDLLETNLQAMRHLHARFPGVKVVHFLNAAYFTKDDAHPKEDSAKIASAIAPIDETGLHIHGWRRLFEASGVDFKSGPTFWGTQLRPNDCIYDCGHEVPISLYSADELRKVVRFSLDTLEAQGFGRAKSFRTGGWMAKDTVREAVAAEGLVYEESAVPTAFLAPQLKGRPIFDWLTDLWKGTTELSQPYALPTPAGTLVEVPDNGALADYVSADQMVGTFQANKAAFLRDRSKNVVVSIGFHHETAAKYVPQLETALARIQDIVKQEKLPFESITTEAIAAPAAAAAPR